MTQATGGIPPPTVAPDDWGFPGFLTAHEQEVLVRSFTRNSARVSFPWQLQVFTKPTWHMKINHEPSNYRSSSKRRWRSAEAYFAKQFSLGRVKRKIMLCAAGCEQGDSISIKLFKWSTRQPRPWVFPRSITFSPVSFTNSFFNFLNIKCSTLMILYVVEARTLHLADTFLRRC